MQHFVLIFMNFLTKMRTCWKLWVSGPRCYVAFVYIWCAWCVDPYLNFCFYRCLRLSGILW